MNRTAKILIVAVLAAAVAVALVMRLGRSTTTTAPASAPASGPAAGPPEVPLPRLLELGSVTCRPCQMMAPILAELKTEYAGRLQVEFIDVRVHPEAARQYGIRLIPTQILYDASGQQRWWHEGFISKEDMLDEWKAAGVDLGGPGQERASPATAPRGPRPGGMEAK